MPSFGGNCAPEALCKASDPDWLRRAQLIVFPGLDHATTLDNVDFIVRHVLAFLGGIDESQ